MYFDKGGKVQQLIHSIKYYGNKELGYLLGRKAALELLCNKNPLSEADILIPVPLHPSKKRERGYNQSEWIAKGIASVFEKPIDTISVRRQKATESQTTHSVHYDRWLNVKDIFEITNKADLTGKHVLLIDDVITSGSTVGACIDVLSTIPGLRISLFVLTFANY